MRQLKPKSSRQLVARAGRQLCCEKGHTWAQFVEDVYVGDTMRSASVVLVPENIPPSSQSPLPSRCRYCGAPLRRGLRFCFLSDAGIPYYGSETAHQVV